MLPDSCNHGNRYLIHMSFRKPRSWVRQRFYGARQRRYWAGIEPVIAAFFHRKTVSLRTLRLRDCLA